MSDSIEFAKDGTTIPDENPTQEVVSSEAGPTATDRDNDTYGTLAGAADNTTALPMGPGDTSGRFGEITTAYGDTMPSTIDQKNLGPSFGGKAGKHGKTTGTSKQDSEFVGQGEELDRRLPEEVPDQ